MLDEFEILKTLDHPNIVRMFEMYLDEKNFYLISEYCQGGELFDRIKKAKCFSESMAAKIMYQILSAVVYCHSRNIVHRDLKPENILFVSKDQDDQLKLIDFGVSSNFTRNSKMSDKQGTVRAAEQAYYIAPEVLRKNYDEKCDIWSCGVILYILLCGYPPFNGSSDNVILSKISKGEFVFRGTCCSPDKEWKNVSASVKDLITKMLTFKPELRPPGNELLNHEWFALRNQETILLQSDVLHRLHNFHVDCSHQIKCKLQHAIMTYIVTQIEKGNELQELLDYFREIDKDKNGVIAKDELVEEFMKHKVWADNEAAEVEIEKILKYIDANMSGQVDFTEFVLATIEREKLLSEENVRNCFKMFDKVLSAHQDADGYLSREELKDVMEGLEADEDRWTLLLQRMDLNSDGKVDSDDEISEEEFMHYLKTVDAE